jgi:hypothetical protein
VVLGMEPMAGTVPLESHSQDPKNFFYFWWYWSLNSGQVLARQVFYHLNCKEI